MGSLNFTEEDKIKTVEFLNMIAKHSKHEVSTQELITFFRLLSHMQQRILPKIEANILEVKKVVEPKEEPKQE
jgi:hypothetical protein